MLPYALILLAVAAACALVVRGRPVPRPAVALDPGFDPALAPVEAWRGAALEAHADRKRLRRAIADALDTADGPRREATLRDALTATRGRRRVSVWL